MLEIPRKHVRGEDIVALGSVPDVDLGRAFESAIGALRRQLPIVITAVAVMMAIALLYILTAEPKYTATSRIIIDPRVSNGPDTPTQPMLLLSDALVVDSEVEVFRSRELATRVIGQLQLLENPLFQQVPGPLSVFLGAARTWVEQAVLDEPPVVEVLTPEEVAAAQHEKIITALSNDLEVVRSGNTYVIDIAYTSPDRVLAAKVANSFMEQYFSLQAEATFENTRRLSDWLGQRVTLLGEKVQISDRSVEEYKQANRLSNARDTRLPGEVEFQAANDQIVTIRSEIINLEASVRELQAIIAQGALNASVDATVRTPTLTDLQSRYAELVARERDLSTRFGRDHQLAKRARDEIDATSQLILEEFGKVAASQQSRISILKGQEAELTKRIDALRISNASDAQNLIQLRELERQAASDRSLYEAMLGKLNESVQEETFRSSPARIIARAVPPDKKSAPKSAIIMAMAIFGGLVIGFGSAFLREQMDNVFRTASGLRDELGAPLIGIVPTFSTDRKLSRGNHGKPPPSGGLASRFTRSRQVSRRVRNFRFAVDFPASMFAETLRALSFATNVPGSTTARVIGITSIRKGEGKSTLSGNFATFMSHSGGKVALIDFDARKRTITDAFSTLEGPALSDLMANEEALTNLQPTTGAEGVFVVRNTGGAPTFNTSDPAFMRTFEALIVRMRSQFDLIVLDLPPLANLVDARVAATVVDHIVLAVEWGQTNRSMARNVVHSSYLLRTKLIGAIYTKVKLTAYNKYNSDSIGEYYEYGT